jgi:hypothetical protein
VKLELDWKIVMTRQEYSFWRLDLEVDECGQSHAILDQDHPEV